MIVGKAETVKLVGRAVAIFMPVKKFLSQEGIVFWSSPVPTGELESGLEVCSQRQHQAWLRKLGAVPVAAAPARCSLHGPLRPAGQREFIPKRSVFD